MWLIGIAILAIGLLTITSLQDAPLAAPPPATANTTTCSCRHIPATAEGRGTCEITEDDTNWCKLKFNDGTSNPAQLSFYKAILKKQDLATTDPFNAAAEINETLPAKWTYLFVKRNLPALAMHAIYDADPKIARSLYSALTDADNVGAVAKALTLPPPQVTSAKLGEYDAIISWGCVQLSREQLWVLIKTPHSPAAQGCRVR